MKKLKTTLNEIRHRIRTLAGFVPVASNYVFMDADAIYNKLVADDAVKYIAALRPSERRMLHFSLGMSIRNAFLLWHPNNPHTMVKLKGLSAENTANSPYHPDNYSWAIIRRLIVAAGVENSASSAAYDASESLTYSLLARDDDSEETLFGIKLAVLHLIDNENWDHLDDVFMECILFGPSGPKLKTLVEAVAGHETKITPVNYLRVVKRAISLGMTMQDFVPHTVEESV